MSNIGIDLGNSVIKIIETDENANIINKLITENTSVINAFNIFLQRYNICKDKISKIILTGIRAAEEPDNIFGIPVIKVDEFMAIGEGGTYLANKIDALTISVGTGTAFIKCENGKYTHLGGTGVGGGTFINLSKQLGNLNSFEEMLVSIEKGNLTNVDLTIQDATIKEIKTLPPDTTSSNFGKLNNRATTDDLVLGVLNLVFETIGMMAAFAVRNEKVKDVIVVGLIATIPYAKIILKKVEKIQNVKFIIPENAEYATVIGAVRKALK